MSAEQITPMYQETIELLKQLAVPHTVYQHADVLITDCDSDRAAREQYHMLGHPTKSVLVTEKGSGNLHVVLTLPEKRRIDWKRLASENHLAKLSIATAEQLVTRTGCQPGTLVPIGLPKEISILLDNDLKNYDLILLSIGCLTTHSLGIPTNQLQRIFDALPNPHRWTDVNPLD